jgi:hypothetical protein
MKNLIMLIFIMGVAMASMAQDNSGTGNYGIGGNNNINTPQIPSSVTPLPNSTNSSQPGSTVQPGSINSGTTNGDQTGTMDNQMNTNNPFYNNTGSPPIINGSPTISNPGDVNSGGSINSGTLNGSGGGIPSGLSPGK